MQTMKNKVSRKLAKSWLGKSLIRVGQHVDEVWMGIGQYLVKSWSAFKAKGVGQKLDESWTDFRPNGLLQPYSSITPKNETFSLNKSGQRQDEIGTENCVKVSLSVRQFGGYQVGQLLGETCVDLGPFYLEMNLVIQPLSFITYSLIADNKRVQDKWLDVPELFLYVVLPDQSL